jgi:hypothetical protein
MDISCEYCVLSGRGLCYRLITCPEESYGVWVCHWVWSSAAVTIYAYNDWVEWGQNKKERKKARKLSNLFRFAYINPLNAELNPICHLLVLLGDLTFMGRCIVSIFQYISNKMQRYTVYLYLETALGVLGGTCTHHQERIQLYLQHLISVTPLLLSAAIVEELEPVWVCCGWRTPRTPPTAHSNRF